MNMGSLVDRRIATAVNFTHMQQVRAALLRGLQSFPSEPGMLAMLLDAEKFSGSQQRLVHHLFEVMHCREGPPRATILLSLTRWQASHICIDLTCPSPRTVAVVLVRPKMRVS